MPKRPLEGTSEQSKKLRQETSEQPHPGRLEQGKGKELETPAFYQDATRFGYPPSREGQGSSAEGFHDMSTQEEHTKIVEYARDYLGLEEIGPHSTDEEIVNAVNSLRREYNQSKINLEGVKRRADATRISQETGYLTDSSEGEPFDDDIDHIVTLHLRQMSDEQKEIYAIEYGIDVDEVEEHWNSKHQKRVNYANRYASDVTIEDSPLEALERVNQTRIWALTELSELDAKANIFDRLGEDNYHSDEDDRQKQEIMQQINTLPRSDILAPRNSRTWKQAQEYYESLRRRPNE